MSLQKFTKTEIKVRRLLSKKTITMRQWNSLTRKEQDLASLLLAEKFNNAKGVERDKIEQTVKEYFNKGEGVSENELPGYDALNSKVDAMIETQNKKKVDAAKIEKNVMKLVQQSDAYKNATDVQKEKLVREARKKLGLKEKSAPSVARLKTEAEAETEGQSLFQKFFGAVKKDAKVTMTEKNLLKKQIKDLARGARDAKSAWMKVSNELSKGIKELTTRGTISDTQAKNVLRKFSKVNMFSQKSIDSFIDYMTKVFANAEYSSKLSQANGLKKDLLDIFYLQLILHLLHLLAHVTFSPLLLACQFFH